jgi:hypothetical protein
MTRLRLTALACGALVIGAAVLGLVASDAHAQRAPAEIRKEFDLFLSRFRAALTANDAAAVTAMTRFPYYWNEMRDAAYFQQNLYRQIFTPSVRRCLSRGRAAYDRDPQGAHNFTLFCGEALFLFTRTPDGFRFAEEGVND